MKNFHLEHNKITMTRMKTKSKKPDKKVLILFCGGTIIMEPNAEGILDVPPKERAIKKLLTLEPRLNDVAHCDVEYIDNIDSSNITSSHWDRMAEAIARNYDL